jgi:dTDP-4-dehydrorhamnose reductase
MNMTIKVAVTGPNGRLGSQLVLMGCTPLECDITKPEEIELALAMTHPDVVINCASKTDVDACETEEGQKKAFQVNFHGVEYLRNAFEGKLIHISTDYIFDGCTGPYTENHKDKTPVNAYGASKLGGEIVLLYPLHNGRQSCIVRTTGLFGGFGHKKDIVDYIIDNLSVGIEMSMTYELMGNQTYVPFLAEALLKLAGMEWAHKIIHIGSSDIVSRYEFALLVASAYGLNRDLLHPCNNQDVMGWVAERPRKGGLKTALAKRLRLPIYTVWDGIQHYKNDTRRI